MSKASEFKTNVMRILEQAKVPFRHHCYVESGAVSGLEVAAALNQDPKHVFKTLVTVEKSGEHFVFVVPVDSELNLKTGDRAGLHVAVMPERDFCLFQDTHDIGFELGGFAHGRICV